MGRLVLLIKRKMIISLLSFLLFWVAQVEEEENTTPSGGATMADPKINKCPLVQEIEAVRVAMKKKTSASSVQHQQQADRLEPKTENSNWPLDAGGRPRRCCSRVAPSDARVTYVGAINIKKHIQRTFDSGRLV